MEFSNAIWKLGKWNFYFRQDIISSQNKMGKTLKFLRSVVLIDAVQKSFNQRFRNAAFFKVQD